MFSALKYTSSGTIKVQLRLECVPDSNPEHDGKMMALTVSDTGKGIAAKFLSSRLFVPFAQVRYANREECKLINLDSCLGKLALPWHGAGTVPRAEHGDDDGW